MRFLGKMLLACALFLGASEVATFNSDFHLVYAEELEEATDSTYDSSEQNKTLSYLTESLKSLTETAENETGNYNLLLIGVDRRDETWNGNSDTMMLVTINYDKDTIYLTSFMRDLYADIPGVGVRKLNHAFAVGGADLCIETIKSNYGVQIDNYAWVDFNDMIAIIDSIGGIDIEISEEEIEKTNSIAASMANSAGEDPSNHQITSSGLVHMDGYLATAYARNRTSGGTNDFGRTERQRKVINAIINKVKSGELGSTSDIIVEVSSHITHDLEQSQIIKLVSQIGTLSTYEVEQLRVPFDDSYYSSDEILIPYDMNETVNRILSTIY